MKTRLAKLLSALLFTVALPLALVAWARGMEHWVRLPAPRLPIPSVIVACLGLALIAISMAYLWFVGRGLPMNAFPPEKYVARGPYALVPHPIYLGFSLACLGVSLAVGSSPGLWVVTPFATLGWVTLVLGYEGRDIRSRFAGSISPPRISLPPDDPARPTAWHRASLYLLVFIPWLILYEILGHLLPARTFNVYLPFEHSWPVYEWTEALYASGYVLPLLIPVIARRADHLRKFALAGLWGTFLGCLIFFLFPAVAPPRPFDPQSPLGQLLQLERADAMIGGSFPSFHVFWACLAACVWALAVTISCITTGMHALVDLPAGFALFLISIRIPRIWRMLLRISETIANSWREWRIGPFRIINHAAYAGAAAMVGIVGAALLAGPAHTPGLALVAFCSLLVAGLWGQALEGSSILQRPFGYYGALVGGILGVGVAAFLPPHDPWTLLAAFATVAPFVQAVGRLRCLVNGCCHGALAPSSHGIRYHHPRSRVCRIAHLNGSPVYPTQLYSLLGNVAIGAILLRLWSLALPTSAIAGLYLLLSGLLRFVEESYRGEPQTRSIARLPIYQWLAILTILAGPILMTLQSPPTTFTPAWSLTLTILSLLTPLAYAFAMGTDLPTKNAPFSRLADTSTL